MQTEPTEGRPWLNRAVAIFAVTVVTALLLSTVSTVMMVRFAKTNRIANLVNCRLLTNAILESGAGGTIAARPPTPQQKLNSLYVKIINSFMTTTEKKRQRELLKEIQIQGGVVTVPNCQDVVDNPDSVKDVVPVPKETQ